MSSCQLDKWLPSLRLDVRRVDDRQPAGLEPFRGDPARPAGELVLRPFEAVVLVPELTGWQRGEEPVVLAVGRRDDHGRGRHELEDRSLEGSEAKCVEMLDDLDRGRGVEASQTL